MKIVIPGIPIPQPRLRHFTRGGFARVYDPSTKQKNDIKDYLATVSDGQMFNHPRMCFIFHMPIPESIPKRDLELYQSGLLKHEKKPDIDNLIKLYLDCLDNIFLEGDQKVSLGPCVKVYHMEPKTIIYITDETRSLTPWEIAGFYPFSLECDTHSSSERDFQRD